MSKTKLPKIGDPVKKLLKNMDYYNLGKHFSVVLLDSNILKKCDIVRQFQNNCSPNVTPFAKEIVILWDNLQKKKSL